jgi:hypothetical protein
MLEFKNPIPVIVKENGKEAMAIYATSSGTFENDLWTIALCDGGDIITVRVDQIKIHCNATFGIFK